MAFKDDIGKMFWIGGVLICSLAFAMSVTEWIGFANAEAEKMFKLGLMVLGCLGAFLFLYRRHLRGIKLPEKLVIYGVFPILGIASTVWGWLLEHP